MSTDKQDHEERQKLASLARLHDTPDFNRFMGYVQDLLDEYMQHCVDAENPARVQGAAQALQRIQKEVAGAEEAYHRLTNQAEIPM